MELSSDEEKQVSREEAEDKKEGCEKYLPKVFAQLEKRIGEDQESLMTKIEAIFMTGYSNEEKDKVNELLDYWETFTLEEVIEVEDAVNTQTHYIYKKFQPLSARVYAKAIEYIKQIRTKPAVDLRSFKTFLSEEELIFSYDRYFWKKRTFKNSGYSYGSSEVKYSEPQQEKRSCAQINRVAQKIKESSNDILNKLHQFLVDIQLISLNEEVEINNTFMIKLERIVKEEQKMLYLRSLEIRGLQDIKTLHEKSFKSNNQQAEIEATLKRGYPNYSFYKSQTFKKQKIANLHSKFMDYRFLQNRHDYIQWMFPNHYGSAFNSSSFPLDYIETKLFRNDLTVGFRMLKSIYIFFDFMGIRLSLKTLSLTLCSQKRLKDVTLVHYHNHLRIMRILACLSVVGFRQIALKLINFIDEYTSPKKLLQRERKEFQDSWAIYGDDAPNQPKKRAKSMCFLEDQTFPQSHTVLRLLKEIQEQNEQVPNSATIEIQDFA